MSMQSQMLRMSEKHGIVDTGTAAWTLPGKIKNCKYIIHAVGPVWSNVIKLLSKPYRVEEMIGYFYTTASGRL